MTDRLRITHIELLPEWIRGLYDAAFEDPQFDLVWASDLADVDIGDALSNSSIVITGKRRATAAVIESAGPGLRLIQVVGRAPWAVDLEAARDAGIPVSFLPHRGAIAVAEHTFALLLGVMRRLVPGHAGIVSAAYQKLGVEPIRTSERLIAFNWLKFSDLRQLHGQTLGLVGLGDIGLEVARRAHAFDMEVLYTKRIPLPSEYEAMAGVQYAPLRELLERSDVVSLHAPQTEETYQLIDSAALSCMKPSAVLINTARGGLVDEDALVQALRSGEIAGAGLDVFLDEPLPTGHPLIGLDSVLFSPHTGGGTGGGQKGVVADVKANVERMQRGETPLFLKSP